MLANDHLGWDQVGIKHTVFREGTFTWPFWGAQRFCMTLCVFRQAKTLGTGDVNNTDNAITMVKGWDILGRKCKVSLWAGWLDPKDHWCQRELPGLFWSYRGIPMHKKVSTQLVRKQTQALRPGGWPGVRNASFYIKQMHVRYFGKRWHRDNAIAEGPACEDGVTFCALFWCEILGLGPHLHLPKHCYGQGSPPDIRSIPWWPRSTG